MENEKRSLCQFSAAARSAFTLIELLVVIAIIAILAAMLLPALQQARERGKASQCANNIATVGKAGLMYNDDSKGYYPMYYNAGSSKYSTRSALSGGKNSGALAPYLGVDDNAPIGGWHQSEKIPFSASKFACPTVNGKARFTELTSSSTTRCGISESLHVSQTPGSQHLLKTTRVKKPSRSLFFGESARSRMLYTYSSASVATFPVAPHNGGIANRVGYDTAPPARGAFNGVFLDGHLQMLSLVKLPITDVANTNKIVYSYFWFPARGNKDW